jgi:HEAT repeat protein
MRAQAQAWLARHGDLGARRALREKLADTDADVQAAAASVLDPQRDAAELQALAQAPAAALRLAAVRMLARAPADAATRILLARSARLDPAASVRVAALAALAAQGPEATTAIEAQLEDTEVAIRLAAIDALVEVDRARAAERLAGYLAAEPTLEGVESARMLLATDAPAASADARALLQRALAAPDHALRGAAAVALMSLPSAAFTRPLAAERAAHEPVRSVRLCLGLALGDGADARALLAGLLTAADVVAAQAAAELARHGDASALHRLQNMLGSPDRDVRRVAADALGRTLDRPRDVRAALLDPDPSVRLAAASAILAV